jgi:hypothetical protein
MKPMDVRQLFEAVHTLLNIDWVYEVRRLAVSEPRGAIADVAIAEDDIAELARLCQIGHLRGLHDKLRDIERSSPAHRDVVTQLRAIVDTLDLKRCERVLEAMRD